MSTFATAEDAYSKDKQIRKEDVQALQEWIKKQPHLPEVTGIKFIIIHNYNHLHFSFHRIPDYFIPPQ